jgi:hypothetical protein
MTEDTEIGAKFRLAGPEIISERFDDGESVVVNLENGFYFSLNPVGGVVFELVASGWPVGDVVAALVGRYDADHDTIEAAVGELVLRLVDEGIISADGENAPSAPGAARAPAPVGDGRRAAFEAPALTTAADVMRVAELTRPAVLADQ